MTNAAFEQLFSSHKNKGLNERCKENGLRVARLCELLSKDRKHDMRLVEDYLSSIKITGDVTSYDIINDVTYFANAVERIEA
jgi:predicted DNA binding CopG/RHH family protein